MESLKVPVVPEGAESLLGYPLQGEQPTQTCHQSKTQVIKTNCKRHPAKESELEFTNR